MPGDALMVPVAQETTANTVRLPYVSAVGLAWWHGAKRRWRSSISFVVALCFAGAAAGAERALSLRQIDEAEFEQRLNAVWQRTLPRLAS